MSSPELVTLTIDDREVQVPPGTGLVEAALAAGIEIPVFCYEPRLGPPVGACRMCLCEVAPGPPKPQAACTLTVAEGMVVKTAATSELAREAQDATLEFILVNHPLDCPVCDKGGECPLQDLTFRYGPGNTRMTFAKRTFEKPIPISPTIALDRERCILCYRCTRFSEAVAEDGQLVARNRGASSIIATFEDEPYRAPFSGNVIELCPVGALTSTQYRFEARPWEIQNVPTVCGLCPVGCNISATTREGKVKRILSRNHPEIDEGWLCDKGRFGFTQLYARDRVKDPLRKLGLRRFEELSWADALDEAERLLRQGPVLLALSGSETVEQAEALSRLVRQGLGSDAVVLPEQTSPALGAFRAPLSSIRDADLVVVAGDDQVEERAPVVALWLKAARRRGAEIVTVGASGSIPCAPGAAAEAVRTRLADRIRSAERAVLVWSGPGGAGGATVAELARELGASTAFSLPATPNGRAVAEAWAAAGEGEPQQPDEVGVLLISGEEAVADPAVRALAERARAVIAITMFADPVRGWVDLVLPGTSYLERDGTIVNLEGRPQRLRRAVIPPAPDEIASIAKLAERFGVDIDPHARAVPAEERASLPPRVEAAELPPAEPPAKRDRTARGGPLKLVRYRPLFSGPGVERVQELQFQRPERTIELSPHDARIRNIATGDQVVVRSNGTAVPMEARVNKHLVEGAVRAAEEHVRELDEAVEVSSS
ncbi:MAG TPA: molybdopterin-dependent oxidoreductase [Gaiellaceae bacterium]|nr:molybdopterin-dependent oxidoreductase [Gaiellaceae bacterium]